MDDETSVWLNSIEERVASGGQLANKSARWLLDRLRTAEAAVDELVAANVITQARAASLEVELRVAEDQANNNASDAIQAEGRAAEAEAVIAEARKIAEVPLHTGHPRQERWIKPEAMRSDILRVLAANGSAVLARVKAEALEAAADEVDRMYAGSDGTDAERHWISGVQSAARRIRSRAIDYRAGAGHAE